jgi:hypothetical protein
MNPAITQQKARPPVGTVARANTQERPHYNRPWPDYNPAQARSEREVAKVLAILDKINLNAIKQKGRAG